MRAAARWRGRYEPSRTVPILPIPFPSHPERGPAGKITQDVRNSSTHKNGMRYIIRCELYVYTSIHGLGGPHSHTPYGGVPPKPLPYPTWGDKRIEDQVTGPRSFKNTHTAVGVGRGRGRGPGWYITGMLCRVEGFGSSILGPCCA